MPQLSFQGLISGKPISCVFSQIHKHPFNQQLARGNLSPHIYHAYLEVDTIYLQHYKEVLQSFIKLYGNYPIISELLNNTVEFELQMQDRAYHLHPHTAKYSSLLPPPAQSKPHRVVSNYLTHLKSMTSISMIRGYTAILPCIWSYHELGQNIQLTSAELNKHPFQQWIKTYKSETFSQFTTKMIAQFDELCQSLPSEEEITRLQETFIQSLQFEFDLYEAVYPCSMPLSSSNQQFFKCRSDEPESKPVSEPRSKL